MVDATSLMNEIIGALENLATQVVVQVGDDRTYAEIWGWNQPSINRHDLAAMIRLPQPVLSNLVSVGNADLDDAKYARLVQIPSRIMFLLGNVIPNIPSGNANQGYVVIKSLVDNIISIVSPLIPPPLNFDDITERQLLPSSQIKRLKGIDRGIARLIEDSLSLESRIALINDAHATAESLPADMMMLADARNALSNTLQIAQTNQAGTETARSQSETILQEITRLNDEATKLVESTQGAFSAATTKGLGEEFGNKAIQLSSDVWKLGALLAITLVFGGTITYFRLEHINDIISSPNFSNQILWAHVILSFVSVAAPIWFAWLLTKQIGQRFRLSEDYAFKASVAKAYAGYSREAARIDPEFQKKLYQTALARIDEEPLRHVETDNHGSPLHELWGRRRFRHAVMKTLNEQEVTKAASATPANSTEVS